MTAAGRIISKELAVSLGVTEANLSRLKTGAMNGIKFETPDKLCTILDCQPGEWLAHVRGLAPDGGDLRRPAAQGGAPIEIAWPPLAGLCQ